MIKYRTPDEPPADDDPKESLDAALEAAFELDPMDTPHLEDSVISVLKARSGVESRIRLKEELDIPIPSAETGSPDIRRSQGKTRRYQVLYEIARGGLGVVMKSRDTDLGRSVAMKLLRESHAVKPEMIRRLIEEAQIGGQLQHPGIVPVYDIGLRADQRPYFTMKLVKGETLAALLKARKEPGEERMRFLRIFEQVCQTIAYAHSRGVLHRDLKPANIMVGSFGEVQVMDWGLAKVLGQDEEEYPAETVLETIRSASGGHQSQAGSVMGTFAFMAPEQARGEVDLLDERCDVFGLGALLCQILTGRPPYVGESQTAIRDQALAGRLDGCWRRLAESDADPMLIALARQCLALEMKDRLRDAGSVATKMEAYLAEVDERARRSEVEAAEARVRAEGAEARAQQERRARRLGLSLAATVVVAVVAAVAGYLWVTHNRQQRMEQTAGAVNASLNQAVLLQAEARSAGFEDRAAWARALEEGRHAQDLLRAGEVSATLGDKVAAFLDELEREEGAARKVFERAEADRNMVRRLEDIRVQVGEDWDWGGMARSYDEAFRQYGIDLDALGAEEAAARIRQSAIARELVAEMDEWANAVGRIGYSNDELIHIADLADPVPWRKNLRKATEKHDVKGIMELAKEKDPAELSAIDACLLGRALIYVDQKEAAITLYQEAIRRHPDDFWLHFDLGGILRGLSPPRAKEAIGCYWAAIAIRPSSTGAWSNLGLAFTADRQENKAREAFEKAMSLNSDDPITRASYARFLCELPKDLDAAIEELEGVLDRHPDRAIIHAGLGDAWWAKGDAEKAWGYYEDAMDLNPQRWDAKGNMGIIRMFQGRYEESLEILNEALLINPTNGLNLYNRGVVLDNLGEKEKAKKALELAIRYDPNQAMAYVNLGYMSNRDGQIDEAKDHYRKALAIPPQETYVAMEDEPGPDDMVKIVLTTTHTVALTNLGSILMEEGRLKEAIEVLNRALECDSKYPTALYNLGMAYKQQGELAEAEKWLNKALQMYPDYADAQLDLGNVYTDKGNLSKARMAFEKMTRHHPNDTRAWFNLGNTLKRMEKYEKARDAYKKMNSIKESPAAHNSIGCTYTHENEAEKAQAAFKKAITVGPKFWLAHYNLAVSYMNTGMNEQALDSAVNAVRHAPQGEQSNMLSLQGEIEARLGRLRDAEKSLREAIEADPEHIAPRFFLGNLLLDLGKEKESADSFRAILDRERDHHDALIDLAGALQAQGRFFEALGAMRRGHEQGSKHPDWDHPSGKWVENCEKLVAFDSRLEEFLEERASLTDPDDQVLLARVLQVKEYPVAAARNFEQAIKAQQKLGGDGWQVGWFQAARAAALAGTGQGHDGKDLTEDARTVWRRRALDWLNKDLSDLIRSKKEKKSEGIYTILRALGARKHHPDLSGIREPEKLATLSPSEREEWKAFWTRVDAILDPE